MRVYSGVKVSAPVYIPHWMFHAAYSIAWATMRVGMTELSLSFHICLGLLRRVSIRCIPLLEGYNGELGGL